MIGDALKLSVYFGDSLTTGTELASDTVMGSLAERGLLVAALLRGPELLRLRLPDEDGAIIGAQKARAYVRHRTQEEGQIGGVAGVPREPEEFTGRLALAAIPAEPLLRRLAAGDQHGPEQYEEKAV